MSKGKKIILMSTSGKVKTVEVREGKEQIDFDAILKEFGDEKTFILPEDSLHYGKNGESKNFNAFVSGDNAPPIPIPPTKHSVSPPKSSYLTISTTPYYKEGDNKKKGTVPMNVVAGSTSVPAFNKSEGQSEYVTPTFPTQQITYKRYWLNTYSVTVQGPQSFSRKITTAEGMVQTEITTMSAELGVKTANLSAKVSISTSSSVSISESKQQEDTYSFDVPDGKTGIWTLWQLVDVYFFVDGNGVPITWTGTGYYLGLFSVKNMALINTFENQLEIYSASLELYD